MNGSSNTRYLKLRARRKVFRASATAKLVEEKREFNWSSGSSQKKLDGALEAEIYRYNRSTALRCAFETNSARTVLKITGTICNLK